VIWVLVPRRWLCMYDVCTMYVPMVYGTSTFYRAKLYVERSADLASSGVD
jgi:hypothetical protein